MKKIIAFIIFMFLSLPAPANADKSSASVIKKNKQTTIERGKKIILEKLKDPDSAKFRNLVGASNGESVCGEVNAKNSMGGYSGFTKFYITKMKSDAEIEIEDKSAEPHIAKMFEALWKSACFLSGE